MNKAFYVETRCPACSAAVNFEEGSQTFHCAYCGSALWIAGYPRTLAYFITPVGNTQEAAAIAVRDLRSRLPGFRLVETTLCFLPYYRYSGNTVWLEKEETRETCGEQREDAHEALGWAGIPASGAADRERWLLRNRLVEKTFLAFDLKISGLYSLGIRASVLPLSIFERDHLSNQGIVLPVEIKEREALELGRRQDLQGREPQSVGGRLSLVYFPFFLARCEKGGEPYTLFVDGLSGEVTATHQGKVSLAGLRPGESLQVIRFRPLKCPNCGWDLPCRPQDVILACGICGRAWRSRGDDFEEVSVQFEPAPNGAVPQELRYLPFWLVPVDADSHLPGLSKGTALRVPAFGTRNMQALGQMTLVLMRKQGPLSCVSFQPGWRLEGCSYGEEEARQIGRQILLLHLLQNGFSIEKAQKTELHLGDPSLIWSPLVLRGIQYIEPHTGFGLLKNVVI